MKQPRTIELLSPAKNADIAIAAIQHGADAVYIGPDRFGARSSAGNSVAEIARAVDYAHHFNARVYATVNTVLLDNELKEAERLIRDLYAIDVDALIVQDMGILRLDLPPIALHASTQCDTRSAAKARFLEDVGFSQIVLARELTMDEISDIRKATTVPLECFVHGALCVSYSGRCHASCALRGRSANRGECAQLCRLPYDLIDGNGNTLFHQKHLLSLRDFNQADRLEALLGAGVSSLKIEGRLKDVAYVKNVTAAYSQRLNEICAAHPDLYHRRANGTCVYGFEADAAKSFNRGFTHYFFDSRKEPGKLSSPLTPKSIGEPLGKVKAIHGNAIVIDTQKTITNGDGLIFFDNDALVGFRANSVSGHSVTPFERIRIAKGTPLRRNFDKKFTDALDSEKSATRLIDVDIHCWQVAGGIATEIADTRGNRAVVRHDIDLLPAQSDQANARQKVFAKLGSTVYRLRSLDNGNTAMLFIPASILATIRRDAVEALNRSIRLRHSYDHRRQEQQVDYVADRLTYTDNVANRLARKFYEDHGVKEIAPAMETGSKAKVGDVLMTTRFCLRREYGRCLRTPEGKKWNKDLTLVSGNIAMAVDFDCANCEMLLRHK